MKKLILTALIASVSTGTFAQDVKLEDLKKSYKKATAVILCSTLANEEKIQMRLMELGFKYTSDAVNLMEHNERGREAINIFPFLNKDQFTGITYANWGTEANQLRKKLMDEEAIKTGLDRWKDYKLLQANVWQDRGCELINLSK